MNKYYESRLRQKIHSKNLSKQFKSDLFELLKELDETRIKLAKAETELKEEKAANTMSINERWPRINLDN